MVREASPLHLTGIPASPGFAEGPLFPIERSHSEYIPRGNRESEAEALRKAIAHATARIGTLSLTASGESAAMLEFQLAMLDDEALTGPAFAAIGEGMAANDAWISAIDAEIAGYEASDNDHFRARAVDFRDIRDQVLSALVEGEEKQAPPGAILFGEDIAPTRFLGTDWSRGGGIALTAGSTASHVAMLARARGVPMVVGLGRPPLAAEGLALLDAEHGGIIIKPSAADIEKFRRSSHEFDARRARAEDFLMRPAMTRNGEPVRVEVNIADPSDVETINIAACDGIGLMRTEFLFDKGPPDEETQYAAYRKLLEWASGKPVTIRTVDAGGDKPIPGLTLEESNPFLGLRGIRLSLARPEVFRLQVRALLRAAMHGNLKVMFPMVAVPEEYEHASALFSEEAGNLTRQGVPHRMPPLGIMLEVPSVAIAPRGFADVAFFSIGSNDLTQYVMAAARDNANVAHLNSVQNPAVLALIALIADFGREHGIPISLCGDAGGDPRAIPALLKAGLRDLSVAPAQLAATKAAIAEVAV